MSTTGDPDVRGPSYETIAAVLAPFPPDRAGFIERSLEIGRTLTAPAFRSRRSASAARRALVRSRLSGRAACAASSSPSGSRAIARARCAKLSLPTLVIHGDADPLVPVDGGRATARAIPGARLEIIAGMGHELPRRVWPRVIDDVTALAAAAPRR